jgi:hypothetical protein
MVKYDTGEAFQIALRTRERISPNAEGRREAAFALLGWVEATAKRAGLDAEQDPKYHYGRALVVSHRAASRRSLVVADHDGHVSVKTLNLDGAPVGEPVPVPLVWNPHESRLEGFDTDPLRAAAPGEVAPLRSAVAVVMEAIAGVLAPKAHAE